MLDEKTISSLLQNTAVKVYNITDSTNTQAIKLSSEIGGNILVAANGQTNGRGRQGKSFYSPSKSGVYFSLIIRPECNLSDAAIVTSAAAVAVAQVIEEMTSLNPKIKWVNDIYIDDKKVCGILVQSIIKNGKLNGLCVGIGVNICTADFPSEIAGIAGSLNISIDKNVFIAKISKKLIEFSENIFDRSHLDYYRKKSYVLGKEIRFYENNIEHYATAIDIDENANLLVNENGNIKKLSGGEISLRLK